MMFSGLDTIPVLQRVAKQPSMFLDVTDFRRACGFLIGYDMGCSGALLVGFREWAIVKADTGNNLNWSGLAMLLLFPDSTEFEKTIEQISDHDSAIKALFDLICEFIEVRAQYDGLRRIYSNYEKWLSKQSWHKQPEGR